MTPQVICEHEDGGVALLESYSSQDRGIFELSEEVTIFEKRLGRNTFLEEEFIFELSEQVL